MVGLKKINSIIELIEIGEIGFLNSCVKSSLVKFNVMSKYPSHKKPVNVPDVKSWDENAKDAGEKLVCYNRIESMLKRLTGQILTIIDAAVYEEKQNKALKDVIKGRIADCLFNFQDICFENKQGHSVRLEDTHYQIG